MENKNESDIVPDPLISDVSDMCKDTDISLYLKDLGEQISINHIRETDREAISGQGEKQFTFAYPKELYPVDWTDYSVPPVYICGNDYIQEVNKFNDRTGLLERETQKRDKSILKLTYGSDIPTKLRIFDGFVNVPGMGDNYKWIIETASHRGAVNLFNPTNFIPKRGEFPNIKILLSQVFGIENLTLGYDYFSIAWQYPYHILPVLVLISKDNSTGKSTFLNFISWLFSGNARIISDEDLSNSFNPFITALFVMCDELQDGRKWMNKIKTLATAESMQLNRKGLQQCNVNTFMNIILAGNDVDNIIKASKYDIRFWVRELPTIPKENWIQDFDKKLRSEIPAFAYFIASRKIVTPRKSRMWFDPEILKTDALANIVRNSRTRCCQDIIDFVNKYAVENGTDYICATVKDIRTVLGSERYTDNDICNALRGELGLINVDTPRRYTDYLRGISTGRYYTISAELEDASVINNETVPF